MAVNDIQVIKNGFGVQEFLVEDRTTTGATYTIKAGEPVKRYTNTTVILATGDPEIATDLMLGIAVAESTETASADGVVKVEMVGPGTILRGKATTAANIDTAAELKLLLLDTVAFDLTTVYFTIDEDEGDDPNVHGLMILDGDIDAGTLDVSVNAMVTPFGYYI